MSAPQSGTPGAGPRESRGAGEEAPRSGRQGERDSCAVAELERLVRSERLLTGAGAVVVMLSGGRDSVCLLDLCCRLAPPAAIWALHVNYGLRGEHSAGDEQHCRQLCERAGVRLRVRQAARPLGASGNLQDWARRARYGLARQLAAELGGSTAGAVLIASAHTASDQVETVLYRLAASPGRRALLGIARREGDLVRPLLSASREQTTAYCLQRGLLWRDDASNDCDRFARARVRNGLLPAFSAIHPAATANLLRTAEMLREESELMEQLVDEQLSGAEQVALARLEAMPRALARALLVRLAEQATGRPAAQAGGRLEELLALRHGTAGGRPGGAAELHLGSGAAAQIGDGVLRVVALAPRAAAPAEKDLEQRD